MRRLFSMILALCMIVALAACGTHQRTSTDTSSGDTAPDNAHESTENVNFYYDFEDILVPSDLKLLHDEKIILENSQFKTGILSFEGRVEPTSVVDFFVNNMTRDNWNLQTALKAKNSQLVFDKMNKSCVIRVIATSLKTRVEIVAVELKGLKSQAPARTAAPAQPQTRARKLEESDLK